MYSGLSSPLLAWQTTQDLNGATDVTVNFAAPFKCVIRRIFVVFEDGSTDANGATLSFDKVSGSTRTVGAVGTITVPAANNDSKYIYENVASHVSLSPGDHVIVGVTESFAGATIAMVGLIYQESPEVIGNAPAAVAG
jgi:hypothetical protein